MQDSQGGQDRNHREPIDALDSVKREIEAGGMYEGANKMLIITLKDDAEGYFVGITRGGLDIPDALGLIEIAKSDMLKGW